MKDLLSRTCTLPLQVGSEQLSLPLRRRKTDLRSLSVSPSEGERDLLSREGERDPPSRLGEEDLPLREGERDPPSRLGEEDLPLREGERDPPSRLGEEDLPLREGERDAPSRLGEGDRDRSLENIYVFLHPLHFTLASTLSKICCWLTHNNLLTASST